MKSGGAPDWISGDPEDLRIWRNAQPDAADPLLPPNVEMRALPPDGAFRGGLLFRPPHPHSKHLIVHFHGGGFVVGSPQTHRVVGAWLASKFNCMVLLPSYRLAPEYTLPTQPLDAVAALEYAHQRFNKSIVLSGDSAGAMVALWGHHFASPALRSAICATQLFYGVYGQFALTENGRSATEHDGLGPRSLLAAYMRIDPQWCEGFRAGYSPFEPEFTLPPSLTIIGAGSDPLREHSERLHAHCRSQSDFQVLEGQKHGFLSQPEPDHQVSLFLDNLVSTAIC